MNNEYVETLVAMRIIRKYMFMLHVVFAVSVLLLPWVIIWMVSFGDMPDDWNAALVQQSLQNGTFWLLPGHVIFQDSTEIGGEDMWFPVLLAVLLMTIVVWGYVALQFRIFVFFVRMAIYKGHSVIQATKQAIPLPSPLVTLFPRMAAKKSWSIRANGQTFHAMQEGRSLILTSKLPSKVPSLFFDSVKNDIAKREGRRLSFSQDTQLVLDGVMYEHFKVYAPSENHVELTHALKSDVLALITKQLDDVEISTEGDTLAAVIDVRKLKRQKDIERVTNALSQLSVMLTELTKGVSTKHELRSKSIESVTVFMGVWPLSNVTVAIIALGLAAMFVVMAEALGSKALTGDMILPLIIIGLFLLTRIYRHMKHRSGIQLFEGTA